METRTLRRFSELPAGNQLGELENTAHGLKMTNFTLLHYYKGVRSEGSKPCCPCNSVWLSNGLDSNAKLRNKKARWRIFFFFFLFKISANGGGQSRKGSWVGDMTSPLMRWVFSLQWKMREWLLCSGWRRKVITLGARGGKQLSPDKVMTREDSN